MPLPLMETTHAKYSRSCASLPVMSRRSASNAVAIFHFQGPTSSKRRGPLLRSRPWICGSVPGAGGFSVVFFFPPAPVVAGCFGADVPVVVVVVVVVVVASGGGGGGSFGFG